MTSFFSTLSNRYVLHHQHVSPQPLFRFDNKLFCIKNNFSTTELGTLQKLKRNIRRNSFKNIILYYYKKIKEEII